MREQTWVLVSYLITFSCLQHTQELFFTKLQHSKPGFTNPDLVNISYSQLQFETTEGGSTLLYLAQLEKLACCKTPNRFLPSFRILLDRPFAIRRENTELKLIENSYILEETFACLLRDT